MALSLPEAVLHSVHLTQDDIGRCYTPEHWHRLTGVQPNDANAWFLFADPFTLDSEGLITALSDAYANTPLVGGLASGDIDR